MTKKYEFSTCRAIGHSWSPLHVEKAPSFGISVDFVCITCTTVRRDIISPHNGELLARYYTYPENYKTEATSKSEWRKTWLRSMKTPNKTKEKS